MINAELAHNPYLLETTVRFNGKQPRINCQIEKYENQALYSWVEKIPEIFYNEMNGYDFELLFTGTKPDFNEIKEAFNRAGVSPKQVELVHKREIEDAYKKTEEIAQLLDWLKKNSNRRFDYARFWQENSSLFNDPYPMILFNGKDAKIESIPVSVDAVESAQELQNSDLTNIPIVFYIDNTWKTSRRTDIEYLLRKKDVSITQLFFYVSQNLTALQKARAIAELGIEKPQIIFAFEDETLIKYLENFPIAEYIRASIKIFKQITAELGETLEEDNKKSVIINKEVHAAISELDTIIASLKTAEDYYEKRDIFCLPTEVVSPKNILSATIDSWKNRRTKVVGEEEINQMAGLFCSDLQTWFEGCCIKVASHCAAVADKIKNQYETAYKMVVNCDGYTPQVDVKTAPIPAFPEIKSDLMTLRETSFVEKSKDILGGIFRKTDTDAVDTIKIVTCYLDQWRAMAKVKLLPLVTKYIDDYKENLETFYNEMAKDYIEHIKMVLTGYYGEKEKAAAQLSGDERLLQIDNDWYEEFKSQVEQIERG